MRSGELIADRFEIESSSVAGGMGTVYKAKDRVTQEPVALKVLHVIGLEQPVRFAREARVLAELSHPCVVRYVAHGTTPAGEAYLVMEWLEGEDLHERLKRGRLTLRESVSLAKRVAEALRVAHARAIVHRDIKPRNIFLVGGDVLRAKVVDFGVAKLAEQQRAPITGTGALLGTAGYMAPEQARGSRSVDARADVFALACVMFKCLTGRAAFPGDDAAAVLARVLLEEAPLLRELLPHAPSELEDLIARMLAKDAAARPADGAAVAIELQQLDRLALGEDDVSTGAPSLTGSEQRLVSVVVADAGMRASSHETLTPSEVLARMPHAELAATVSRFGARLETIAGGCIVAVLSGKPSATDQAAQAARCALALRAVLPSVTLAVATGRGETGKGWSIGEVIDSAVAKLRAAGVAEPQGEPRGPHAPVLVDEVTAGLLDPHFDVVGKRDARELLGERLAPRPARLLLGKPTPCVGREREIGALLGSLDECIDEPVARAVVVTAPAGAGKSRLRYEFVRAVSERDGDVLVLEGRGDPMRAGSPFSLIGPPLRTAAGIVDGEPLEDKRRRVAELVARYVGEPERRRVAEFVAELLGLPFDDAESAPLRAARRDAVVMGDQMRGSFQDLIGAMCKESPVVLVLDDVHWGDLPSVSFVDAALRELGDRPLMVLALARPDVHSLFPRLWSARAVQEIRLGPLRDRAAEKLVRAVLGDGVDRSLCSRIIDRAEGNAFYLEELIRAVSEGQGDALPETVLAVAQARLEALEPQARRALRAASLFGNVFWQRGVAALIREQERADLPLWLAALDDRELVTRRTAGKFPGDVEYAFRHSLLREAAYTTLTGADRALGHRLAGAWLEQQGEVDAVVLAEHFERGGERDRASVSWRVAADQALEANDFAAAVARAERGVACGASAEALGTLRLVQAEAHWFNNQITEGLACSRLALGFLRHGSSEWFSAAGHLVRSLGQLGRPEELETLAAELGDTLAEPGAAPAQVIALARTCISLLIVARYAQAKWMLGMLENIVRAMPARDATLTAWLSQVRSYQALYAGDAGGYVKHTEDSIAGFEEVGDSRAACNQRGNLGDALIGVGMFTEAESVLRDALASSERMGIFNTSVIARLNLALTLAHRGALDEARVMEAEGLELVKERGDIRLEGAARGYMATILMKARDFEGAEEQAKAAVGMLGSALPRLPHALALLSRARLLRGDVEGALATAREASTLASSLGRLEEGQTLVALAYAEALHRAGHVEEAHETLRAAHNALMERASRILDDAVRRSFLENVEDNARTIALSREWLREA